MCDLWKEPVFQGRSLQNLRAAVAESPAIPDPDHIALFENHEDEFAGQHVYDHPWWLSFLIYNKVRFQHAALQKGGSDEAFKVLYVHESPHKVNFIKFVAEAPDTPDMTDWSAEQRAAWQERFTRYKYRADPHDTRLEELIGMGDDAEICVIDALSWRQGCYCTDLDPEPFERFTQRFSMGRSSCC